VFTKLGTNNVEIYEANQPKWLLDLYQIMEYYILECQWNFKLKQ